MRTEPYSALFVGVLIIVGVITGLRTLPTQAVVILGTAASVGFIAWLATTYRYPVQSRRVIATYLVAVAFQIIHLAEEHFAGFAHEFTVLFDSPRVWSESSFLAVFVFAAGCGQIVVAGDARIRMREKRDVHMWRQRGVRHCAGLRRRHRDQHAPDPDDTREQCHAREHGPRSPHHHFQNSKNGPSNQSHNR